MTFVSACCFTLCEAEMQSGMYYARTMKGVCTVWWSAVVDHDWLQCIYTMYICTKYSASKGVLLRNNVTPRYTLPYLTLEQTIIMHDYHHLYITYSRYNPLCELGAFYAVSYSSLTFTSSSPPTPALQHAVFFLRCFQLYWLIWYATQLRSWAKTRRVGQETCQGVLILSSTEARNLPGV